MNCTAPRLGRSCTEGLKSKRHPASPGITAHTPFPYWPIGMGSQSSSLPLFRLTGLILAPQPAQAPAQKMLQNYQQWQHHEQCYWVWIGVHGPTWVRCHVAMCQALAASLRSRRVVDAVPHGNLDLVTVAKRVPKEASTSPQRSLSLTFSLFIRVTKLILAPPPWPHLPLGKRAARMADLLNSDLRESIPSFSSPLPAQKFARDPYLRRDRSESCWCHTSIHRPLLKG